MEESSTDTLSNDIPVSATTHQLHLLVLHDLLQLGPHFPHLPHGLDVNEVVSAPGGGVTIGFPKFDCILIRKYLDLLKTFVPQIKLSQ